MAICHILPQKDYICHMCCFPFGTQLNLLYKSKSLRGLQEKKITFHSAFLYLIYSIFSKKNLPVIQLLTYNFGYMTCWVPGLSFLYSVGSAMTTSPSADIYAPIGCHKSSQGSRTVILYSRVTSHKRQKQDQLAEQMIATERKASEITRLQTLICFHWCLMLQWLMV